MFSEAPCRDDPEQGPNALFPAQELSPRLNYLGEGITKGKRPFRDYALFLKQIQVMARSFGPLGHERLDAECRRHQQLG